VCCILDSRNPLSGQTATVPKSSSRTAQAADTFLAILVHHNSSSTPLLTEGPLSLDDSSR
jgi:hypothetical protein